MRGGAPANLDELLESRSRWPRILVLAISLVCSVGLGITALIHLIPPRPYGIADDFRVFYAAATMLARGRSPYSAGALRAAEQVVWHYGHLQANLDLYAYLPVTATVLEPLTKVPFWVAYTLYTLVGLGVASLVVSLVARDLGWRHDRILVAAVMSSWVGLLGALSGNVDFVLLASIGGGMLLSWRGQPLAAGLVLGVIWVKPDVAWPAAVFLALALWPQRGLVLRFAAGFASTSTVCLLVGVGRMGEWWAAVVEFGHTIAGGQYDLAGLPSLAAAAPRSWGLSPGLLQPSTLAVLALGLLAMLGLAVWMLTSPDWSRVTVVGRVTWAVALGMGVWLVVTPYAHTNDDLLLVFLLMLTVGRDAHRVHGLGLWLSLAVVTLLLLVWPSGVVPWGVALMVLLVTAAWLWRHRTDPRLTGFGAALALLSLALLPGVAPFHLLLVSLTPLAGLVLLVEGSRTCWLELGGAGTGPQYAGETGPP